MSAVDNRNRAVTASVVSFEGKNSVYRAVIRPPEVACVITISLAENVVDEGNPAYSKNIRISTRFPDADAETPTELFNPNRSGLQAIAATPTRIFLVSSTLGSNSFITRIYSYTYSGTGEEIGSAGTSIEQIDFINGEFLTASRFVASRRYNGNFDDSQNLPSGIQAEGITHTRLGYLWTKNASSPFPKTVITLTPYDATDSTEDSVTDFGSLHGILGPVAHQNDLLYLFGNPQMQRITPQTGRHSRK